jgi:hypothetical protein
MREDYEFVVKTPPHDTSEWVKIELRIKDKETGEIRSLITDGIWSDEDDEVSTFIYSEGNFSCDCNRFLFFNEAAGIDNEDTKTECGDVKFLVNIYTTKGKQVYREFDETEANKTNVTKDSPK